MRLRVFILYLLFAIFTAAVVGRLFSLQVLSYGIYKNLAENQHQLFQTLIPSRGEIFIKDGKNSQTAPLVTNIAKDLVYAVPPEITDKEKTAAALAKVLGMTKADALQKISDDSRKWVAVKKELPESVSLGIKKLNLPGIYLQSETYRVYPEGGLAAQVLGFLGNKGDARVGQYGIEEYFQNILAGHTGSLVQDRDLAGRWITGGVRKVDPAEDGANITLSIDRAIQYKTEAVLNAAMQKFQAESGTIIVVSPKTGAILAMANAPSFDPANFGQAPDQKVYRNLAVSEPFEPGSVFKAITMAAGLDSGAITPDMTYEDTGSVTLDGFVIKNALNKVHGIQTMTQVLEQSINTGAIFAEQHTGKDKFLDMIKRFGFGEVTGITLPAESPGNISNLEPGSDANYATASFGQGLTVTPLQLAMAYAAIANGGKLMKPYIAENIRYGNGRSVTTTPEVIRQVIAPQTANQLSAMLVSVVENGHGKRAGVPGYYIAGKTGTAQVARTDGRGYDPSRTIGSFAGFGPVDDPQFVIAIKMVNPKATQFAESSAAPTFGELATYLLNYFQVPPTRQ